MPLHAVEKCAPSLERQNLETGILAWQVEPVPTWAPTSTGPNQHYHAQDLPATKSFHQGLEATRISESLAKEGFGEQMDHIWLEGEQLAALCNYLECYN